MQAASRWRATAVWLKAAALGRLSPEARHLVALNKSEIIA
jgi:hypothetical protein